MEFLEWLMDDRVLQTRSAHDVLSHLRRVKKILGSNIIDENTIGLLEKNNSFQSLSSPVRNNLRRSVRLYLEFETKQ